MAHEFDPYHKWLGILPKDQPPNHYRLLGLELYEDDPDVISAAADRQQSFLRSHQSGERGAEASRLMNEVARARLCLLKPETKRAYDAELRRQKEAVLSANTGEEPPQIDTLARSVQSSPRKRRAWALPVALGGSACVAIALLGIMSLLPSGPTPGPNGDVTDKLLHKDDGFCCLTQVAGAFRGGGEVAGLSVGKDGYWYLGGKSAQFVVLRAISVRLRKTR